MKTLTNEEFEAQQTKFIEECSVEIKAILLRKLNRAINSGAYPEHWKQDGSYLLTKAIISSFCKDDAFKMADRQNKKHADNLHLFL